MQSANRDLRVSRETCQTSEFKIRKPWFLGFQLPLFLISQKFSSHTPFN